MELKQLKALLELLRETGVASYSFTGKDSQVVIAMGPEPMAFAPEEPTQPGGWKATAVDAPAPLEMDPENLIPEGDDE